MKAEIQELRIAANRAATALIAGRVSVAAAVEQFVKDTEPVLLSAAGFPLRNECETSS